jgi:hypothetical protein
MGAGPPTRARVIVHGLRDYPVLGIGDNFAVLAQCGPSVVTKMRERSCRWHFKRQERI